MFTDPTVSVFISTLLSSLRLDFMDSTIAVSYTHLDVYKRQVYGIFDFFRNLSKTKNYSHRGYCLLFYIKFKTFLPRSVFYNLNTFFLYNNITHLIIETTENIPTIFTTTNMYHSNWHWFFHFTQNTNLCFFWSHVFLKI